MLINSFVRLISSLRLTVVLLGLAILLVFFGTLAQVNEGLYQAQHRWFHSFLVWWTAPGGKFRIPFLPGGYLVGTVLVVNLITAHIFRFRWGWSKLGIHITHVGLVLLLIGQLATDVFSRETTVSFAEGESRNYSVSPRITELVFSADAGDSEEVVAIPQSLFRKIGEIHSQKLPFTVRVVNYYPNSAVFSREQVLQTADQLSRALSVVEAEYSSADTLVAMAERSKETEGRAQIWREALKAIVEPDTTDTVAAAKRIASQPALETKLRAELKTRFQQGMYQRFKMQGGVMGYVAGRLSRKEPITEESFPQLTSAGAGKEIVLVSLPEVKTTEDNNLPAMILELGGPQGALGTWAVHPNLTEQSFPANGKTWRMALRFERHYHPFSLQLLQTKHEVYRGTDIPKNFQSRVRIENPGKHESREVDIYMNNPLRYEGLTFYQYQMGRDEVDQNRGTSVLQVVRNPSWLTPYIGCALVGGGLVVQFLMHLVGFIKKRRTA